MTAILDTSADGRFRVILEQDTDADPSDRQGSGYVYFLEYRGHRPDVITVANEYDKAGAEEVRAQLAGALDRFPGDLDTVARYFRTIGAQLDYFDTRDGRYVGIVTPELEKVWGCDPGTATPDLSEFKAREDGDVYGYTIEERCTWTTNTIGGVRTQEGWESVDYADNALWGLYGYAYAEETAREAFAEFLQSAEESSRPSDPA